jgi:hypothetical protein
MSLSLIKELWFKTKNPDKLIIPLNEDQDQNIIFNNQNNSLISEDYKFISDFFSQKFPEVRDIFSKFNSEDYYKFIINSSFNEYSEKELIFAKNAKCDSYLFILYGDIDFFDNKEEGNENILIKTISAGKVYGHLVKESYKYNLIARSNISLIEINKKIFDELIININKIKNGNILLYNIKCLINK